MKRLITIYVIVALVVFVSSGTKLVAATIGPSALPSWESDAQVKLGWVFNDPQNPQNTGPAPGGDQYIGDTPPVWSYDPDRTAWDMPGQWYVQIPNLDNDRPYKRFWLSYVYERDPYFGGTYVFTNIDWNPFDHAENAMQTTELFDINGDLTQDNYAGVYERMTFSIEMYPNPLYEEIWLGLLGNTLPSPDGDNVYELLEVYVITQCVPEPATIGLLSLGGLALLRKRKV